MKLNRPQFLELSCPSLKARLQSRCTTNLNGCWEFQGSKDRKGYCKIQEGGRGTRMLWAHRAAYALFRGPIPEGMTVDHTCLNPCCCNPDHLALLSLKENTAKGNKTRYRRRRRR